MRAICIVILVAACALFTPAARADSPRHRQPAGEIAQERPCPRSPPGHDRRHDRQARHGRRPRVLFFSRRFPLVASRRRSSSRPSRPWPKPPPTGICVRPGTSTSWSRSIRPASSRSEPGPRKGGDPPGGALEARGGGRRAAGDRRLAVGGRPGSVPERLAALATIGGQAGRSRIEALAGPDQPVGTRITGGRRPGQARRRRRGVRAAEILASRRPGRDLTPLSGRISQPARGRGRPGRGARLGTPRRPTRPGWRCGPSTPWAVPTRPWSPRSPARPASPPRPSRSRRASSTSSSPRWPPRATRPAASGSSVAPT